MFNRREFLLAGIIAFLAANADYVAAFADSFKTLQPAMSDPDCNQLLTAKRLAR